MVCQGTTVLTTKWANRAGGMRVLYAGIYRTDLYVISLVRTVRGSLGSSVSGMNWGVLGDIELKMRIVETRTSETNNEKQEWYDERHKGRKTRATHDQRI